MSETDFFVVFQVSEKMADGRYRVTFTEYGNEQVCSADMMRAGMDKVNEREKENFFPSNFFFFFFCL